MVGQYGEILPSHSFNKYYVITPLQGIYHIYCTEPKGECNKCDISRAWGVIKSLFYTQHKLSQQF